MSSLQLEDRKPCLSVPPSLKVSVKHPKAPKPEAENMNSNSTPASPLHKFPSLKSINLMGLAGCGGCHGLTVVKGCRASQETSSPKDGQFFYLGSFMGKNSKVRLKEKEWCLHLFGWRRGILLYCPKLFAFFGVQQMMPTSINDALLSWYETFVGKKSKKT